MRMSIETQIARSAEIVAIDVMNAAAHADMKSGIQISVMIDRDAQGEITWIGAELGHVEGANHATTCIGRGDLIACGRETIIACVSGLMLAAVDQNVTTAPFVYQADAVQVSAEPELINPATDFVFTETKNASDPADQAPKAFKTARGAARQLVWDMYAAVNNVVRSRGYEVDFAAAEEMVFTWRVRAYRVFGVDSLSEIYVAYLGEASGGCGGETIIVREFDDEADMVDQMTDAVIDYAIWDQTFDEYADRAKVLEAA